VTEGSGVNGLKLRGAQVQFDQRTASQRLEEDVVDLGQGVSLKAEELQTRQHWLSLDQ